MAADALSRLPHSPVSRPPVPQVVTACPRSGAGPQGSAAHAVPTRGPLLPLRARFSHQGDARCVVRPAVREAGRGARRARARAARAARRPTARSSRSCAASRTRPATLARELFAELTPWQKVQLSRHPTRPYTLDYIERIFDGLRRAARRPTLRRRRGHRRRARALRGPLGRGRRPPEGPRHQGQREAQLRDAPPRGLPQGARASTSMASRFGLPILTFIDTPGAYPGIGAEERGQSEAIGACLAAMSRARVPIVATIIGEGGSGGALALGVANRVLVLEYGDLQRHLARGLRVDSLEGRRQGRRGGGAPEDDGAGSPAPRRRRPASSRSPRAARTRTTTRRPASSRAAIADACAISSR